MNISCCGQINTTLTPLLVIDKLDDMIECIDIHIHAANAGIEEEKIKHNAAEVILLKRKMEQLKQMRLKVLQVRESINDAQTANDVADRLQMASKVLNVVNVDAVQEVVEELLRQQNEVEEVEKALAIKVGDEFGEAAQRPHPPIVSIASDLPKLPHQKIAENGGAL